MFFFFFYFFFRYFLGGFENKMKVDRVFRVGQATETLANLGGVGSKFTIPVRVSKIVQNNLQNNVLSVQTGNGQIYSAQSSSENVRIGSEALVGDGFMTVPLIYTYLDTIVVGAQPQVVGICPEEENPYSSLCTISTTVSPSDGFRVLGANFASDTEIILSKIQGSNGGCQTMTICAQDSDCALGQSCVNGICADLNPSTTIQEGGLVADVSTAQTGVGSYAIAAVDPGGSRSNCVSMIVTTNIFVECGNSIVEDGEECDPPENPSDQCFSEEGEILACKSNCKCEKN